MSLMKTGALHNDPYCFCRIEEKLLAEELKWPFNGLRSGLGAAPDGVFRRLGRIFSGRRDGAS